MKPVTWCLISKTITSNFLQSICFVFGFQSKPLLKVLYQCSCGHQYFDSMGLYHGIFTREFYVTTQL